jgi:hypothetical protein
MQGDARRVAGDSAAINVPQGQKWRKVARQAETPESRNARKVYLAALPKRMLLIPQILSYGFFE